MLINGDTQIWEPRLPTLLASVQGKAFPSGAKTLRPCCLSVSVVWMASLSVRCWVGKRPATALPGMSTLDSSQDRLSSLLLCSPASPGMGSCTRFLLPEDLRPEGVVPAPRIRFLAGRAFWALVPGPCYLFLAGRALLWGLTQGLRLWNPRGSYFGSTVVSSWHVE